MAGPAIETLWTVGHGARPAEDLVALLRRAGIGLLVDVRSFPGSRRHPQFGKERLAASLAEARIDYVHERDLGGFRTARPDSPNVALRVAGLRGYADHIASPEFEAALDRVLDAALLRRSAVMCAETDWRKCHRSTLADAVLARGWEARHLLPDGTEERHELHPAARVVGAVPVYDRDAGQATLLPD